MKHPNILWIQTDEQRPDSLACYGSQWARTPNVDRIASQGTVFSNATCPSPMCLPSRTAQLAARYPHEYSCLNNMLKKQVDDYPEGYRTFAQTLGDVGYETVNFGRYDSIRPNVFARNERTGDCMPEFTGYFDLNERYDEDQYHVIKRPGPDNRPLIVAGTYPGDTSPSDISAGRAVEFLSSRTEDSPPFLCRVGFNQPHTPTLAPTPFDTLYNPDDIPVRLFNKESLESRSAFDKKLAELHRMDLLSDDQIRQVWKDYMGLCAYVDMETGRVLDALEEADLAENTLIFYSTDHGKSLGEWGSGEKGTFDREVWRVPFIWSFPGVIPAGTDDTPCGTIDTARTLFGVLGLDDYIDDSWRGRNLFDNAGVPDASDTTYDAQLGRLSFGTIRHPVEDWPGLDSRIFRVAVRSIRYRCDLNWYTDGSRPADEDLDGSLYDLQSDPNETQNRFTDPAAASVKERLLAAIDRWLKHHPTGEIMRNTENAGVYF